MPTASTPRHLDTSTPQHLNTTASKHRSTPLTRGLVQSHLEAAIQLHRELSGRWCRWTTNGLWLQKTLVIENRQSVLLGKLILPHDQEMARARSDAEPRLSGKTNQKLTGSYPCFRLNSFSTRPALDSRTCFRAASRKSDEIHAPELSLTCPGSTRLVMSLMKASMLPRRTVPVRM